MQDTEIVLSDNEIYMLKALASRAREQAQSVESLLEGTGLSYAQGLSALGYLCAKGLAQSEVIGNEQKRVLRKAGQEYLEQGLPEQRLWHYLLETGALTLQEINAYLPQSEAKFTIGMYRGAFQKAGCVAFNSGTLTLAFWVVGTILGVCITLALAGNEMRSQWFKAMMERLPVR